MTDENRHQPRLELDMQMEVRWGEQPPQLLATHDLSDTGAFLMIGRDQAPPEGSELWVTPRGALAGTDPKPARAQVIRITDEGIGIRFL